MDEFKKGMGVLMSAESYSGLPTRSSFNVKLRVWRYPSFDPYKSWTIIKDRENWYVRRIVWNQRSEQFSTEPITFGTEKKVEPIIIQPLLSNLEKIEIPVFQKENSIGMDGVISGVEFGNYMTSSKFSWWCDTPSTWRRLQAWHENAIKELDGLLPICTADL